MGAFDRCRNLKEIKVEWKDPASVKYEIVEKSRTPFSFYYVPTAACTFYVPAGSEELYKAHDVWKDFKIVGY